MIRVGETEGDAAAGELLDLFWSAEGCFLSICVCFTVFAVHWIFHDSVFGVVWFDDFDAFRFFAKVFIKDLRRFDAAFLAMVKNESP